MLYKLVRGRYMRLEGGCRVKYIPGDTFEPTPDEIRKLKGQIEPVHQTPVAPNDPQPESKQEEQEVGLISRGGGWFELPNGEVVQGKDKAVKKLGELLRAVE